MAKNKTAPKDDSVDTMHAADGLGFEARSATGAHAALKLWLRMLSCTTKIENEIRSRLRSTFGITLPRFDLMAQPAVGRVLLVPQVPDHVHRHLGAGHRHLGVGQSAHQVLVQQARHGGQQRGAQNERGQARKAGHLHREAPFNALPQQMRVQVQRSVGGVEQIGRAHV